MKSCVIEKPGTVVVKEHDRPRPTADDVVVRIRASGICGTDVHIFRGDYLGEYPVVPGHEFAGDVVEVGDAVTRFRVGDRVAIEPNIACDNCPACLRNEQNFCHNWQGIGVTRSGGMAEFAIVPQKAAFDIGTMPYEVGAFVEPLACVLHGVERLDPRMADSVAIIGAGPIGILLTKVLLLRGVSEITQVDRNEARLKFAEAAGAAVTTTDLGSLLNDHYDVVIDATGVPGVMQTCINYVRPGGRVLLFGVPPQEGTVSFPAFPIFRKGLTILSSFTSVRNSIQAVRLLGSGRLEVESLISHRYGLNELERGLEIMESGEDGVMKIQIFPEGK